MATTRVPYPSAKPIYAAAALWKQRCLVEDRALFDPSMRSTLEDAQVLVRDFVESPDLGSEDFATKLRGQLATSSTGAVQLAAELLYVYLLVARSEVVSGQRKRAIVTQVLEFDPSTAPMPAELAGALDSGLVRPGQAYNNLRWRMFGYLVEATVAIKSLPAARREEVLSDPVALTALLDQVSDQGAWTQRHALEHLLLPDFFPRVVSRQHRSDMLRVWPELAGSEDAPESLRIAALVQALEPNVFWGGATFVNTYRSPYQWQWQPMSERWGTFTAWAGRIAGSFDLAVEERPFKLAAYQRAAEAKQAMESGSQDWVTLLKRAFTKDNNLVAFQVYDVFLKWVVAQPEAGRQALEQLWRDPGPESVDRFVEAVPADVLKDVGGRLSVASFLLGAVDPTTHPQWRSRAVDTAYRLVDYPKAQPTASVGERYESFLAFLDLVVDAAHRAELPLEDRLDAQGLVWAAVKYEAGADWAQGESDALASWRAGKGTPPPGPVEPGPPKPGRQRGDAGRHRRFPLPGGGVPGGDHSAVARPGAGDLLRSSWHRQDLCGQEVGRVDLREP